MPEQAVKSSSKAEAQNGPMPFAEFMPWGDGHDTGALPWLQPSVAPSAAAVELAQSWVAFWQSRLESDLAAWKALAACRTPAEAMACPQRFAQEAANQYLEQFKTTQKLSQSMLSEMFAPVRDALTRKA